MACHGTKIKKRLQTLRGELEECIEPLYGLLSKLESSDVLTEREHEYIESRGSHSFKQCQGLLDCMQNKTSNECEQFIVALHDVEQTHVANYISREACRFECSHEDYNCWPLEQIHKKRIRRNSYKLEELIECEHSGLIGTLFSRQCINRRQMSCFNQLALTDTEKTKKLLKMLRRRSIRDYNVFVDFLKESEDMSHLACLFEDEIFVEAVDCTISSSSTEPVNEVEDKIVKKFPTIKRMRNFISKLIYHDCHPKTELAAMKVGHSIRCFFFCGTPDALQSLYISINNESLTTTMQSIFQQLYGCEESIFVVKINGHLNLDEQTKRVAEFCTDIGSVSTTDFSGDLSLAGFKKPFRFPNEVLEPILLQVAVKLFEKNQVWLLLPRPDVTALVTVSSVGQKWFEVITGRRTIRWKLKSTFKKLTCLPDELFKAAVLLRHRLVDQPSTSRDADVAVLKTMASVCRRWMVTVGESGDLKRVKRIFHYNSQLLYTLSEPPTHNDGLPREVKGVEMLENFVYVVYDGCNKVEVFDCEDCYKKVKDIEVEGMKHPCDVVVSSVTSQLFIYDWRSGVIWRVDLTTRVSDVFIKLEYSERTRLSLVENRLLVTSDDSLLMYDIHSGERIKTIPYTEDMKERIVIHAIESNRGSFYVSLGKWHGNTVFEMDSECRVIRVFNNYDQLGRFLALDSVGRLLVTDYNNFCVFLIDEEMTCKTILIDKKRLNSSRPWTLNYNNNRLAVGLTNGQVKIFELKNFQNYRKPLSETKSKEVDMAIRWNTNDDPDLVREAVAERRENEERLKRRNNIIILNVPESKSRTAYAKQNDDMEFCRRLMETVLKIGYEKGDIVRATRLGKFPGRNNRALLIEFSKTRVKDAVIDHAPRVSSLADESEFKGITILHDMSPGDREQCHELMKKAREMTREMQKADSGSWYRVRGLPGHMKIVKLPQKKFDENTF